MLLERTDITAFLNRLAYLQTQDVISGQVRFRHAQAARQVLGRMRTLALTRPGRPLHGLPDDFVLTREDMPDLPEDQEAGRDLPAEVLQHLCACLDQLEGEVRVAVELLVDTGRRPEDICRLPWDCLRREHDGKAVLVYDNHKANRLGRRLPISEATATLITKQQKAIRDRFPQTRPRELKLLPSPVMNPDGTKPISENWVSNRHRRWVASLPELAVPTAVEDSGQLVTKMLPFDKGRIFLYAYRHSFAQRHADAGVPPDVLRDLMDHRDMTTTQCYYRVSEKRLREAVERVTTMQFDRHGKRIWREAKALLDSEHARRAIGEVAVPYGVCTEPSNVAAGGQDCPVRFRCVGCGHFRTDVSYLPDLESYLGDLLRNRERLLTVVDADTWAKNEAMPSDEEISRIRRLIDRVRGELDQLTEEDHAQTLEAVTIVRRARNGLVGLGLPRIRQPLPDVRPERPA
ncbi:site-specific integrase [Streptomyces sp. A012304]|uniref:tyrosine-type recombinase/integrase n=1 Tax=Streptomyces sp. A012304 TaxID=375446 RepID=UPI0022325AA1|nr:site-specific integrase [Streptomyces sp. A012304]